jgi:hypothetical protein
MTALLTGVLSLPDVLARLVSGAARPATPS